MADGQSVDFVVVRAKDEVDALKPKQYRNASIRQASKRFLFCIRMGTIELGILYMITITPSSRELSVVVTAWAK